MKSQYFTFLLLLTINSALLSSCKKYLDARPDKKSIIPTKVADLQGLLDYYSYMNTSLSEAGEIASDNYFLTAATYASLPKETSRLAYLWQPGMFQGQSDWQRQYNTVYQANVVLDYLPKIIRTAKNSSDWDNCKGEALCFRAKSFFEIAQIWSKIYDSSTANTSLGIPLRLTSDFNQRSSRATIQQTYDQIIRDLKTAANLLPNKPAHVFRPSRPAAYGLLARTYLTMGDYQDAKIYSDSCLQLSGKLLDYNKLNVNLPNPFAPLQYSNPEDIIHSTTSFTNLNLAYIWARVDTGLFQSYDTNDLRRAVFFEKNPDGYYYFNGSYDGNVTNYNGIATDEIYLTRAECRVRLGDVTGGMEDLNALLVNRWKTGSFVKTLPSDANDALKMILRERRKELLFRMLRFTDIKRLNRDGANITLRRIVGGHEYTLPAKDPRFALPIPDNVIEASGIQQN